MIVLEWIHQHFDHTAMSFIQICPLAYAHCRLLTIDYFPHYKWMYAVDKSLTQFSLLPAANITSPIVMWVDGWLCSLLFHLSGGQARPRCITTCRLAHIHCGYAGLRSLTALFHGNKQIMHGHNGWRRINESILTYPGAHWFYPCTSRSKTQIQSLKKTNGRQNSPNRDGTRT